MRIHAIQTGTVAVKRLQREGKGRGAMRLARTLMDSAWTEPLPIYAWVIEHPEGVIVVDTGETSRVSEAGYFPGWHPYFRLGVREWVLPAEEIGPQLGSLGFAVEDIRFLVMTHLHTDHAGGLAHFPQTEVLVNRREYEAARGWRGKLRGYLPDRWPRWFAPRLVDFRSRAFGPFPASLPLTDKNDVWLVSTPGHTAGHMSVAVQENNRVVFLAGDTSYTQDLMFRGLPDGVGPDVEESRKTLERIGRLTREVPTIYLPSHDPDSKQRLEGNRAAKREAAA